MIVVLVALEVERSEIRKRLHDTHLERHPAGTHFDVGTLTRPDGGPPTRVALALVGQGNPAAGVIAERAINHYKPAAVLFVGVAGGLRDWLALGDVVVATKVYAYQGGRSEDGAFRAYPQAWPMPYELEQVARHLALDEDWADGLDRTPRVHFEPIAAGEVVVNGRETPEAHRLRQHYADAVAVEMESAGAAHAGHVNHAVPTATVRGISDHAGGHKDQTDAEGWQPRAAAHAAAFALALAARIDHHGASAPATRESADSSRYTISTSGPQSPVIGTGGTIRGGVHLDYREERRDG
ncbi:5'-methylthioadenosine/S-adenosylhomocysteine nucleosidase [Verrucosispora sp. WMMA2044]|uniref:5'-methylthioadenosine/S-adenosylhomocysteine nucleosidase family protein n=1 Tax=Verrucosispora sp. WMMA2044 TaxID=3016419 RepID=UPI00248CFCF6|nr:5'-methylthioadenosine/S-adenosylhomocysteine nucleosidase [Verrucosispora sp. WMMA2044]WBB47292.1 5'-methylthioadenosine/S-adenosylhomocysteine nucleosidase [Verrucosispora sp. WMMA2044]